MASMAEAKSTGVLNRMLYSSYHWYAEGLAGLTGSHGNLLQLPQMLKNHIYCI